MAIIRGLRPGQGFYVLSNKITDDERLSLDGLGLLVFLLSRPDSWEVQESHLKKRFNIGRDKCRKLLTELVSLGYAEKRQARNDAGTFDKNDWVISESPLTENTSAAEPLTEKPFTDYPSTANQSLNNNLDITNTELNKNNISELSNSESKRRVKTETWKQFFDAYPPNKKGGTDSTAWEKAKSLKLTDDDFELMLADVLERRERSPTWYAKYALGITRYLNEKIWLTPVQDESYGNSPTYEQSASDTSWADEFLTEDDQSGCGSGEQPVQPAQGHIPRLASGFR